MEALRTYSKIIKNPMHRDFEQVLTITSLHNPHVKSALKLRERRERDRQSRFLIEGYRELARAVEANQALIELFFCPELFLGANEEKLIGQCQVQKILCTERIFRKMSYRDRPDGLLAVAPKTPRSLSSLTGDFFVIAESIEKPGNLGTILRSSDGAGVDGVIVCDRCTDLYNPNVVRSSVGTLFSMPVVEASGEETLLWLKEREIRLVAATPHADLLYQQADLAGPIALVVGTEQYGLSQQWEKAADVRVKIPMLGAADSLNVAVATSLILYEAVRQRDENSLLR